MADRRTTLEQILVEYGGDETRRVTQEQILVEYGGGETRRVTLAQVLVEWVQLETFAVSQFGVYVEYHVPDEETGTQVRGWDQIQPGSVMPDRFSPDVAGDGLAGGGEDGALRVNPRDPIFWPPTAQGQAVVSDGSTPPAWTASLTPTWLGQHTFSAGLAVAAAQAITMGDEAYIGCGPADVRIIFDAGNNITFMGGAVGINQAVPLAQLHVGGAAWIEVAASGTMLILEVNNGGGNVGDTADFVWLLPDTGGTRWASCAMRGMIETVGVGAVTGSLIFTTGGNIIGTGERLRILDTGFVGIGTTGGSPDRLLHVEVADAVTNAVTYAQRLSHITSVTPLAGFGTGIEFELEENDLSNEVAAIIEAKWSDAGEGANADAYFDFLTMLNDGAAASRMVVGYNGFVGAGIGTPAYMLDVYHATDDTVAHFKSGDDQAGIAIEDDDTQGYIVVSNNLMQWGFVNSLTAANITTDATGQLGVGTMVVDRLLHVSLDDAATNAVSYIQRLTHETSNTALAGFGVGVEFELQENDASLRVAATIEAKWSDAGEGVNADGYLDFLTMLNDGAAASRMVVGYNGYVGINTPAPGTRLYVLDTSATVVTALSIENDSSANNLTKGVALDFVAHDTATTSRTIARITGIVENVNATDGMLQFFTREGNILGAAQERIRITKEGYVGVGWTTPDVILYAADTTAAFMSPRGGTTATFKVHESSNPEATTGVGFIEHDGFGDVSLGATRAAAPATLGHVHIFAAGTEQVTILGSGQVGFGVTAPLGPFHVFESPGSGMFTTADDVDNVGTTIVPNGAGDVAVMLTVLYSVSESAGGTSGGSATVLNNSSVDLYDDGTDILTLAVAADGSVTLQRTAGAATFDISMWMAWL